MRASGVASLAVVIATVSCSKFSGTDNPGAAASDAGAEAGTEAAGSCPTETCDPAANTACWFYDFADATCPAGEWSYFSEPNVGSTLECGGALHVTAIDTADVEATFSVTTPRVAYAARITLELVINEWDGGRVLAAGIGGSPAFVLFAGTGLGTSYGLRLCPGTSPSPACVDVAGASLEPGTPHKLAFDITPTATRLSVDCGAPTELPPTTLEQNADLHFAFGKVDGKPIDGSIDDVRITWAKP